MGILTIWREFRSKQSGEKRHQRGRITHGERLRAEQSQDWRRFREEQVEASGAGMGIWDLAGSSGSLSSHFTGPFQILSERQENIHRDCQKEHP